MEIIDTPFEKEDIIWAKLQGYPWWPAKIIQICQHKKTIFFKVAFYADPTYCYLKEIQIIPFEEFKRQMNSQFRIQGLILKAINLANNAYNRKNLTNNKNTAQVNYRVNKSMQMDVKQMNNKDVSSQFNQKSSYLQQSTIQVQQININIINLKQTENAIKSSGSKFAFQKSVTQYEHGQKQNGNGKRQRMNQLLTKYNLKNIPQIVGPKFKYAQKFVQMNLHQQLLSHQIQKQPTDKQKQILAGNQYEQQQKSDQFVPQNKKYQKIKQLRKYKCKKINKKNVKAELTEQDRKIKFINKMCSVLIQKGFNSFLSRQITIKINNKINEKILKFNLAQQLKFHEVYFASFKIVQNIDLSSGCQENLAELFCKLDLYFQNNSEKQDEKELATQVASMQPYQNIAFQ